MNFSSVEIHDLLREVEQKISGFKIQRVLVPHRERIREGFMRSEFAFHLYHRKAGETEKFTLYFSIKPQFCYFYLAPDWAVAAKRAPQSAFIQFLCKYLENRVLTRVQTIEGERTFALWFEEAGSEAVRAQEIGLVLQLIPSKPQAWVINSEGKVLAHSHQADVSKEKAFVFPVPRELLPSNKPKLTLGGVREILEKELANFSSQKSKTDHLQPLRQELKKLQKNRQSLEVTLQSLPGEETFALWKKKAEALLSLPRAKSALIVWPDWCPPEWEPEKNPDKKLPSQLAEEYFSRIKKQQRKTEETSEQLNLLNLKIGELEKKILDAESDDNGESGEASALSMSATKQASSQPASDHAPKLGPRKSFSGKVYISREKYPILAGRNAQENRELTLKIARGNDLWFHLRGKPSAHVVVMLPAKKSASLETLLDAAHVVLAHTYRPSELKFMSALEVDYVHKKHVKSIPGSTEVRYSQNKTLNVRFDEKRWERVFGTQEG